MGYGDDRHRRLGLRTPSNDNDGGDLVCIEVRLKEIIMANAAGDREAVEMMANDLLDIYYMADINGEDTQ